MRKRTRLLVASALVLLSSRELLLTGSGSALALSLVILQLLCGKDMYKAWHRALRA